MDDIVSENKMKFFDNKTFPYGESIKGFATLQF